MVEKRRLQFKILSHVCQLETAQNMLRGIFISRCQVEEPKRVREEVKQFFMKRFEESSFERSRLDGVEFKTIRRKTSNWWPDLRRKGDSGKVSP